MTLHNLLFSDSLAVHSHAVVIQDTAEEPAWKLTYSVFLTYGNWERQKMVGPVSVLLNTR